MKFKAFKDWKILTKILSISVATIVLIVSGILFYVLPLVEKKLMNEKKATVGSTVDTVATLIDGYHAKVKSGELTEAEAKKRAIDNIRSLRYEGNEYFWINTVEPVMVMHPIKPDLEGKKLDDIKDPNGKQIFVEMAKVAKEQGEGDVEYQWSKPGATAPSPKISHVQLDKEWGWVIGSGIYVDDVKKELMAMRIQIIAATLIFALLIFAFAFVVARRIRMALGKAITASEHIAAGDLTAAIEASSEDETGQLLRSLREMNDSLSHIVAEVRTGADSIASATEQISAGNADLSQRTEEQASALEETASSMEELTSTVKQNADNAQQANKLAMTASDVAERGGNVIGRVVDTMGAITESSRKISDIIGVIDGIAFQTNILALNAAVEAARAGEQGRGFAVVAGEVRNLAQRSAAAAKEIKSLIEDSVSKVEDGSRLVEEAGETTREIVTSIKRVADIMAEISAASIEQSSGIEQVNTAITQMDDVTQQNAALVEEAAAAAEALEDQARTMVSTVSRFKLADGGRADSGATPKKERKPTAARVSPIARNTPAAKAAPKVKAANGYHKPAVPEHHEAELPKAVGYDDDWKEF
ncbi:cache domain-containing protein [Geobacter hydrogenophilus]|uniref:Methyl-accepting chemotaxis protein n=1 Tax=Geobacter hydrogenophilus TaxID=40983 RepID=A0A9W6FY05_9BACT|nr:methyl-accepting chemotaxis protein [Geobacter hydrogenophilus]MBT0895130.1 cache domain-containing protein [Geobacter hydrogenophilus]GLI36956.1 methyl-accepting chemotaxis protein [Geobacter hydrogenophilus]